MALGARVKSVVSGDTIVLASKDGKERTLSLAYVSAPRLASGEPYGFEAREALRTLLVGKPVQFRVIYEINGREYGDVSAPVFKSLVEKALGDGTVRLRDDAASKAEYDTYEGRLEEAATKAQKSGLGVNSNVAAITPLSSVPQGLFGNGKEYQAIVERVIAGDRLQVRVLVDKTSHYVGPALIAGIRAPRSSTPTEAGEPYGDTSQSFVEARLLQRSIGVKFVQPSKTGVPITSVSHPAGDIAQLILSSGLANVADWQSQYLGAQSMSGLRAAERKGRDAKLGLWKDSTASSTGNSSAGGDKKFEAIVARVVSSDTFVLRLPSGQERTVQLASVRAPRKNEPSQAPYVGAAKEFARSKYIAKKVDVTVEAVRPKSEQFEERQLVSMDLNGKNIALAIVDAGYATVIRHRKDDLDRSPIWDELLEKESAAIAAGKGMHSKKAPPIDRIVDASENVTKARGFFTSLERQSRIPAVVDHVSSGGRLRLNVPRENCVLTLVLSGVRVPRPNEPFGDKALDFVSRRLLQRDVQFNVISVDKTGGFIGHVFLPGKNSPLSLALAAEGLAELHEYSSQQSGYYQQLLDAEKSAQDAKKGIWENYVPEEAEEEVAPAATASSKDAESAPAPSRNYIDITVTDVSPSGTVSYRPSANEAQFAKISADLTSFNNSATNSTQFAFKSGIKRGELVTANVGSSYYRAKVLSFEKPDKYTIQLLDVGTIKNVSSKTLRPLPSQFSSTAALAKSANLSFIQYPPKSYMDDYVAYLDSIVKDKKLVANVDSPTSVNPPSITIYTANSQGPEDSVNSALINEGYAFVKQSLAPFEKSPAFKSVLDALKEMESGAKADRIGVWEYGDPRDLEE